VQGAFYPVPKKLEVYGATSQVFGDKDVGFGNSNEVLGGVNRATFAFQASAPSAKPTQLAPERRCASRGW